MGYLLIPLLAGGEAGVSSLAFYFVSYFLTTIAAFGVIAALSREGEEVETLDGYQGLGARRPFLAAVLALAMLSLAGIPLTIGFMAKFAIFSAAAHAQLWLLLVLGLVNSGVSAYYYLQVLAAMYLRAPAEEATWRRARPGSVAVLAVLSLSVLALGVYPGPLLSGTQSMARAWLGEERSERRVVTTRARGGQTASLLLQVEQLPQRADQHGLGVRRAGALAKRGDGLVK